MILLADRHLNARSAVIPAIITFVVSSAIVFLYSYKSAHGIRKCTVVPRLSIASIAFSADGRVLVNEKGMLPVRIVDLHGLPKVIRQLATSTP